MDVLDSVPATVVLFGLRRARAFRAATHSRAQRLMTAALSRMHWVAKDSPYALTPSTAAGPPPTP
jgi:hypothetical protein